MTVERRVDLLVEHIESRKSLGRYFAIIGPIRDQDCERVSRRCAQLRAYIYDRLARQNGHAA